MAIIGWQPGWQNADARLDALEAQAISFNTRITTLETRVGSWSLLSGSADPTAGAGVAATQPALYGRVSAGVLSIYAKTGTADTAWTLLVTQVFVGELTVNRLLVALAGSAGSPAVDVFDGTGYGQGLHCEAIDTLSVDAGGIRYGRFRGTNVEIVNTFLALAQYLVTSAVQQTALSANTDNLALTAVAKLRLTSTGGPFDLTGVTGGTAGRGLWVENGNATGGDNVVLPHDRTSTAANRWFFAGAADLILIPGQAILVNYSGVASRWLAVP